MEDMIKKIVEADAEARANDEKNQQEKAELNEKIEAQAKQIYDSYMAKAEQTVRKNNAYEEKNAASQWAEIEKKSNSVLIKLRSDFEANCDVWSDEIVKRTIQ